MLHVKFQDNRTYGPGTEGLCLCFSLYTIYRHGDHLGHMTWTIYINFRFPFPRRFHMKFGIDWPSDFRLPNLTLQ